MQQDSSGQGDVIPHTNLKFFEQVYESTPPWDIGQPQPAIKELAKQGKVRGKVLDVGCGTGEHALMAAALGLDATGIDGVPAAIAQAERKAADRNLKARFFVRDVLDLAGRDERFDTIVDSGLFHCLDASDAPRYVEGIRSILNPGGAYILLCFSDSQPGMFGPRKLSKHDIESSFAGGFEIASIEPATIHVSAEARSQLPLSNPAGADAWIAEIIRT